MPAEGLPEEGNGIEKVYQPGMNVIIEDDIEAQVFPDIVCTTIGFPKKFATDDVDIWVHEFTELSITILLLYETQGIFDPYLYLETVDGKAIQSTVWHFLTALCTVSGRVNVDTKKIEKLSKNRYLKRFKLGGSEKRAKP
jgi:hypothetical protein